MAYKTKEARNRYHKNYFKSHPDLKISMAKRARMKYWRNKLIKLLNVSPNAVVTIQEINKLSEEELKTECYKIIGV